MSESALNTFATALVKAFKEPGDGYVLIFGMFFFAAIFAAGQRVGSEPDEFLIPFHRLFYAIIYIGGSISGILLIYIGVWYMAQSQGRRRRRSNP